jgi:hypothetical protein
MEEGGAQDREECNFLPDATLPRVKAERRKPTIAETDTNIRNYEI